MTPVLPIAWLFPELHVLGRASDGSLREALDAAAKATASRPPIATALIGRGDRAASPRISSAPLDRASASARLPLAADGAAWLLPIETGDGLEDRLRAILAIVSSDPATFREATLIPFFVTRASGENVGGPVQTRLHASWFGVLPGDRYGDDVRDLTRELIRLLHPDRAPLFLALENAVLGGFDLAAAAGPAAAGATEPAPSPASPLLVAICGIDGSGKSTHLEALRQWMSGEGIRVGVHKIFRHGVFHETVTDLTRQCAGGRNLHLWRIERLAKVFDSVKYLVSKLEPDLARHDVVLFDRYVYTHDAAIRGRSHEDLFARELLAAFPRPHATFLLDLPAETALARISARGGRTVDENPYMLGRYRDVLLELAPRLGFTFLDASAPFESNQAVMREVLRPLLDDRGIGRVR